MVPLTLMELDVRLSEDRWLHVDPVNIPQEIDELDVLLGDATPGEPVACVRSSGADIGDFISTELFHVVLVSSRVLDAWRAAGITGWRSLRAEVRLRGKPPLKDHRVLVVTGRCGPVDYPSNPNRVMKNGWVQGRGLLLDEGSLTDDIVLPRNTSHVIVRPNVVDVLTSIHATNWSVKPIDEVGWEGYPSTFGIDP